MIQPSDREQCHAHCGHAQNPPLAPPSNRVWIDKSIWNAGAETEIVAMLKRLRAANPSAIEKGPACGLEIRNIVATACIPDERMSIGDARIRDLQSESGGFADHRLIAAEDQQPRSRRVAIDREQACRLRPSQHGRLENERTAFDGGRHRR